MTYTAAVIGTGADPETRNSDGFAMGYEHAEGYRRDDRVELVACADLVRENAAAFAERFDLPEDRIFIDHERMLEAWEPDVVSIAVPPAAHADLVLGCIDSGVVSAIHSEKPIAMTWAGCRQIADAATDVQVTFNHQRRTGTPFVEAKSLLDAGEIGDLKRLEFGGSTLYDYGSHQFDLASWYAGGSRPAWVLCGLDYRDEDVRFGTHNENHATVTWAYENGVTGFGSTGDGRDVVACHNRLIGSDGEIVVDPDDSDDVLRIRRDGEGWESVECHGDGVHHAADGRRPYVARATAEIVDALEEGRPSILGVEECLPATALIFGAWESVRRRGRVEDPLEMAIEDNPLEDMVERGLLNPE